MLFLRMIVAIGCVLNAYSDTEMLLLRTSREYGIGVTNLERVGKLLFMVQLVKQRSLVYVTNASDLIGYIDVLQDL